MIQLVKTIDDVLRGKLTRKEDLAEGRVDVPVLTLVIDGILLGVIYGICMGLFAVLREENPSVAQMFATAIKIPLLFVLTLVVTYPSLYVVSALFDSRLGSAQTLRLLLAAVCANLALLASLGPVTAFFTLSTESYPFMVVLNVLFMGIAGIAGLSFLRRALDAVFDVAREAALPIPEAPVGDGENKEDGPGTPPTSTMRTARARPEPTPPRRIFTFWIVIYGVVGAQMGWILRPFIGSPSLEFTFFRERHSNFFQAIIEKIGDLFS